MKRKEKIAAAVMILGVIACAVGVSVGMYREKAEDKETQLMIRNCSYKKRRSGRYIIRTARRRSARSWMTKRKRRNIPRATCW